MLEPEQPDILWLLIVGFIFAFILAFGIGANDVANSFGTSVGAKVLTLFQACVIASIFELAGAILIGSKVSDTVRKGIIDINKFNGSEEYAMAGSFSALTGTSAWLLIATFFNLPVSGTHSIVGATIGYALVALGAEGITWKTFGKIAASWVISPIFSGIISCSIFFGIDKLILLKEDPLSRGLFYLPFMFGFTMFINLFSILYSSGEVFGMGHLAWYIILSIAIGISIVLAVIEFLFGNPYLRKKILKDNSKDEGPVEYSSKKENVTTESYKKLPEGNGHVIENKSALENGTVMNGVTETRKERARTISLRNRSVSILSDIMMPAKDEKPKVIESPSTAQLFKYLQVLTAAFGAFAHGGNDVSNAIGPVISLWLIYRTGQVVTKVATPIWILLYGGVGIIAGLCIWGRRVIKTIGENLSPITPSSGFAIEIGSALTVLIASNLGIPVSTTHCKVGSVVFVGRLRSKEVVNWKLFGNIVLSWIVTMPITGGISAGVYAILREVL